MRTLEGKTAFITGAASGIGLALAERCAEARMNVVLADIEEQALKDAVARVEARQVQALGVTVNTILESSVMAAAETAIERFGKVHVLCPGMVDTNIHSAERNRPTDMAADAEPDDAQGAAMMQAMLARGKKPSEIADAVIDAITGERFYILPHPAWDDLVRDRTEQILARAGVATVDMAEIQRRREAGETF